MTGEYRMTMDPSEKDALLHTPQGGMTWMEEMGLANKADRWQNYEKLGNSPFNRGQNTRIFDPRTDRWAQTDAMAYGRWYPTLVTLPDGSGGGTRSAVATILAPGWRRITNMTPGLPLGQPMT